MMDITYSTTETLEAYEVIFKEFKTRYKKYSKLNKEEKLIYFTSGLGITNSIHENFVKCILEKYSKIYELSKNKKSNIIRGYKGTKSLKGFIGLFDLNLNEAFSLEYLAEDSIESVESILTAIGNQKDIRNEYLHGDINFKKEISEIDFNENVIEYQKLHIKILKLIEYTFDSNISSLPPEINIPSRE